MQGSVRGKGDVNDVDRASNELIEVVMPLPLEM
jgi:hypothetical protein